MEQIIKTYGRFLLEAVCLGLLLGLWMTGIRDEQGNVGVFPMIGASMAKNKLVSDSDFASCVEESGRELPQIFYKKAEPVQQGTYDMGELFGATDCEGKGLAVRIETIHNPKGIEALNLYQENTGQICFLESGVYTVELWTNDAWNQTRTCMIQIPVN